MFLTLCCSRGKRQFSFLHWLEGSRTSWCRAGPPIHPLLSPHGGQAGGSPKTVADWKSGGVSGRRRWAESASVCVCVYFLGCDSLDEGLKASGEVLHWTSNQESSEKPSSPSGWYWKLLDGGGLRSEGGQSGAVCLQLVLITALMWHCDLRHTRTLQSKPDVVSSLRAASVSQFPSWQQPTDQGGRGARGEGKPRGLFMDEACRKKFAHGKNSGLESEGWGWMLHLCEIQSSSGKKNSAEVCQNSVWRAEHLVLKLLDPIWELLSFWRCTVYTHFGKKPTRQWLWRFYTHCSSQDKGGKSWLIRFIVPLKYCPNKSRTRNSFVKD